MARARILLTCLLAAALARADEAPPSLEFVHDDCVMGVAFSPDGIMAASCDNEGLIRVWSTLSGRELVTLRGHGSHVASIRFTPDSRRLISGSYDNTVRMWDVDTGKEVWRSNEHDRTVYKVRVAPGGRHFATATTSEIVVWDAAKREPVQRLQGADPCAFSPDGRRLAAELGSRTIAVYDLDTGRLACRITPEERSGVSSLVFTSDGRAVVAGLRSGDVVVYAVASGERIRKMSGHTQSARGLAISPDGLLVASGSWDTSVRVWELATGGEIARLSAHRGYVLSLAFSPDGGRLLSGARDNRAILWDLDAWLDASAAPGRAPSCSSGAGRLERLWDDLAARDARLGYAAVRALARSGDEAVAFLAGQPEFAGVEAVPDPAVRGLVRDLDAPSARVRDRAMRRLRGHGLAAETALVEAKRGADSPEVRRRIEHLLAALAPVGGWAVEDLRAVRAIHALAAIGTPAARRLLERLSRELEPRLRREARHALAR